MSHDSVTITDHKCYDTDILNTTLDCEGLDMIFVCICGLLMIGFSTSLVKSFPINNGFSIKFNPLAVTEELRMKSFGPIFAKIPQEFTVGAQQRRQVIAKSYYADPPELGAGCSNQVAKVIVPVEDSDDNIRSEEGANVINLPLLKQQSDKYKILVASAPPNVQMMSQDVNNPLIIYVVFGDNTSEQSNSTNLPIIYFVKKRNGKIDIDAKEKAQPIFIIDSNRTVTGLKSKEVEKFVKFKSKLTGRYKYEIA